MQHWNVSQELKINLGDNAKPIWLSVNRIVASFEPGNLLDYWETDFVRLSVVY